MESFNPEALNPDAMGGVRHAQSHPGGLGEAVGGVGDIVSDGVLDTIVDVGGNVLSGAAEVGGSLLEGAADVGGSLLGAAGDLLGGLLD